MRKLPYPCPAVCFTSPFPFHSEFASSSGPCTTLYRGQITERAPGQCLFFPLPQNESRTRYATSHRVAVPASEATPCMLRAHVSRALSFNQCSSQCILMSYNLLLTSSRWQPELSHKLTRDGNVSPIQREIKSNAIISQANSKKQETEGATLQSHWLLTDNRVKWLCMKCLTCWS